MRTAEQGALTSADLPAILGLEDDLRVLAHGTRITNSIHCAACKAMSQALGDWSAAHQLTADEMEEYEKQEAG